MAQRLAMIDVVRFRRDWLSKDINGVWRVMLYRSEERQSGVCGDTEPGGRGGAGGASDE